MSMMSYYEGLKEGKILAYLCEDCKKISLKPSACPFCGSKNLKKIELETGSRGTVVSFTRVYVAPEHFTDQAPYFVVLVDMDNGPRVMGQFNGEAISVGDKVVFKSFKETPIGVTPVFEKEV